MVEAVSAEAKAVGSEANDDAVGDSDEPQVHPMVLAAEAKQATEFAQSFGHGTGAGGGADDDSDDDEFGPKPLAEAAGAAAASGGAKGIKYVAVWWSTSPFALCCWVFTHIVRCLCGCAQLWWCDATGRGCCYRPVRAAEQAYPTPW